MDRVVLVRHEYGDHGTFGRITIGDLSLFTGELPWRNNAPNISCIPPGVYQCDLTMSVRFKRKMYGLKFVKGRSGVRIHSANLVGDVAKGFKAQLQGCIALGERLGWLGGQKAVMLSQPAVRRFETLMGGKPFILEVR